MRTEIPPPVENPASMQRSIFLIGPMGSGKSAVGQALAKQLGRRFIDSDTEIEYRTGVDIPLIFEKEGEKGFRDREREVIADLTQLPGIVLATGGGAVLLAENREHLMHRGMVIYLETSLAEQRKRTRRGRHRPLLLDGDPEARLAELMTLREPLYRGIAHGIVSTDRRRVADVASDIATLVKTVAAADR